MTWVISQIRVPAISSSRAGTACWFNGYDKRCREPIWKVARQVFLESTDNTKRASKRSSERVFLHWIHWAQNAILSKESVKGKSLTRNGGTKHMIARSRRKIRNTPTPKRPMTPKRASEGAPKYYAHNHLGCADGLISLRRTAPTQTAIHTPLVFAPILVFFAPAAGFCALARPLGSSPYRKTN